MIMDEYGEVINGEKTYKDIKLKLENGENVLIGWTDQIGSHYDILFSKPPIKTGPIQFGLGIGIKVFVSIMFRGAFGFSKEGYKSPGYISEKLHIPNYETAERLADLINGVIGEEE